MIYSKLLAVAASVLMALGVSPAVFADDAVSVTGETETTTNVDAAATVPAVPAVPPVAVPEGDAEAEAAAQGGR
jgi:hypothetical protein